MLDDPRVNFAISMREGRAAGISHLGIQAEEETELAEVYDRLGGIGLDLMAQSLIDEVLTPATLGLAARRHIGFFAFHRFEHPDGFLGVTAERPFAIDVFPGLDCGHDRQVMIGHLHADCDQIDIRMAEPASRHRKMPAAPRNTWPLRPQNLAASCVQR